MWLLKILIVLSVLSLTLGLIQPWRVLWWMSAKNRLKVLVYYGIPLAILLVIYFLTK